MAKAVAWMSPLSRGGRGAQPTQLPSFNCLAAMLWTAASVSLSAAQAWAENASRMFAAGHRDIGQHSCPHQYFIAGATTLRMDFILRPASSPSK